LSVYRDTLFRVPYSSKPGENRPSLPIDHNELSAYDHFRYGLMGYIEENQKKRIIKLTSEVHYTKKNIMPIKNKAKVILNSPVTKLLKETFDIDIIKVTTNNTSDIFYYKGKCKACNINHTRKDSQYLIIFTNIYNLIQLSFKCWVNQENNLMFYVSRNNVSKVKCKFENIVLPSIDKVIELVKLYQFQTMRNIQMPIDEEITRGNIEVIDVPLLSCELLARKESVIAVKATEGLGKTYNNVQFIGHVMEAEKFNWDTNNLTSYIPELTKKYNELLKYKPFMGKKFVITSPNISTLSNIAKELERQKIGYTWYNNVHPKKILNCQFKVLLITINSLHYLVDPHFKRVRDAENIIFWNDEVSHTFNYIDSTTLDGTRYLSYNAYNILVKTAYKKIFTCADLTDNIISILNEEIKQDYVIIHNKHVNKNISSRTYNIIDDIKQFKTIINNSLNDKKKICIITDSINVTKLYFELISETFDNYNLKIDASYEEKLTQFKLQLKQYRDDGNNVDKAHTLINEWYQDIFLINSENNNEYSVLKNINEIVVNKKVLIGSPSFGIGLSVEKLHFDIIFGIYTGMSVTCKESSQLLNRIRYLKETEHYVHFVNINKRAYMTDYHILMNIYKDIASNRNTIFNELKAKLNILPDNKSLWSHVSDFLSKIYVWSIIEKNKSMNNFKYGFIKELLRRKVTVNIITNIDSYADSNKSIKKKDELIKAQIIDIETKELFNVPLITDEYAEKLKYKQMHDTITLTEKLQLSKYRYYNTYNIYPGANINIVINFINNIAKKSNLWRILNNWRKFIVRDSIPIQENELDLKEGKDITIHKLLTDYLIKIGFADGILSSNIIQTIDQFDFGQNDVKILETAFEKYNDVGRYRGKDMNEKTINKIKYISKLIEFFYGVKINYKYSHHKKNKFSNFYIVTDNVVREYLIVKFGNFSEKFNISGKFLLSDLHNIKGTYINHCNHYYYINEDD